MKITEQLRTATESFFLESEFAAMYPAMYEDDFNPQTKFGLWFDLDKQEFFLYDDENGQYKSAFKSQHNATFITYVTANDAICSSIEAIIDAHIQQQEAYS